MLSMKGLMRITDRSFLLKTLYLLLFCSLIPVGEVALLLIIEDFFGHFLLLALLLSTGLLGAAISWRYVVSALKALKERARGGVYPAEEFATLAGSLICAVLLITPGLITDVFGLLFVFPVLRRAIGRTVTSRMEHQLKEFYEYMKL